MLPSPNIPTEDIKAALKINSPGSMMDALIQAWLSRKTEESKDAMIQMMIGELVALKQLANRP